MSFLSDIEHVEFRYNQYIKDKAEKKQIYLHHTASGPSGVSVFRNWNTDSRGRIATCVCISNTDAKEGDGRIVQGFSSKY